MIKYIRLYISDIWFSFYYRIWIWSVERQLKRFGKKLAAEKLKKENALHRATCKELECWKCDYGIDAKIMGE